MHRYELSQWVDVQRGRHPQPASDYLVIAFPDDGIREEYLAQAGTRPEEEIRDILRNFVGGSRTEMSDSLRLATMKAARALESSGGDESSEWVPRFTEHDRRVILRAAKKIDSNTWEGLTWVLDLLPHFPQEAINVIRAFITAHAQVLPDLRINGLSDAIALMRARYITQGSESPDTLMELILSLDSREFEFLVARLYRQMGYEPFVTPRQKDRGKDVVARRPGETVFIECKNWRGRVDSTVIASLTGRVEIERATRGVVVGTSGFTSGLASAEEVAASSPWRISLLPGLELIRLFNAYLGSEWHRRLERVIQGEVTRQNGLPRSHDTP